MNKRPRILYIQKPPGGGSVVALYEMIRMLDKTKFEPVVLCYELNNYTAVFKELSIETVYLSNPSSAPQVSLQMVKKPVKALATFRRFKRLFVDDRRKAKQLADIIGKHKPDLIHHNNDINDSRQAVMANRQIGLPQVCHYRSLKPYHNDWFNRVVDRFMATKIDHHIFISNAVAVHFSKALHIPASKGSVLRDIVDVEKFASRDKDASLMNEFGFEDEDVILSNIGRLSRWKGQHVFIDALINICTSDRTVKALVVGPYDKGVGDPGYHAELVQKINQHKLQQQILLTGNRHDVEAIISISDIVVHSAVEPEPQGLVIVEALLSAKPVIVANAGGAAELIVNNDGGTRVTPGDTDELHDAILQHIAAVRRQRLQPKPVQRPGLLNEFVPSLQIAQLHALYHRLLN